MHNDSADTIDWLINGMMCTLRQMTLRRREQLTHAHTLTCTLNASLFITVKNTWQCSNSVVRTRIRRRSFYCGILLSFIKVVVVLCSFSHFASCLFAQLSCDLFVLLFLWFFGVSLMSHAFSQKYAFWQTKKSFKKLQCYFICSLSLQMF